MTPSDKQLLDRIVELEGKDLTKLSKQEKQLFDAFEARAHEFGVTIEIASEAPIEQIKQGTSSYSIEQVEKYFPNQIIIKRTLD
ncbi:hypothetical protein RJD38_00105 [Vibrio scophthalmi]|uniref:Uncharacterized protein n=1 Tax=Vibrio scophthalmi TaxID=45658 RepID=A0A1B1NNH0_9VIBR|nr:hypothetical protein [Vibrio scophthalmi]ANS85289.1 hypothetical protein VSVS12_01522 [Vibrio scophthalmi]ANU36226.1 hypothetical protein VSVS05_01099 [Vibrio scophthalmi]